MARFIANIQGARGPASRLGSAASGIESHTRGWDSGARVHGHVDGEGRDIFDVYVTSGSRGVKRDRHVLTLYPNGQIEYGERDA